MPQLVVEAGPDSGKVLQLSEGDALSLGRGAACAFCLSDTLVSREHCRFQGLRGRWYLKNLRPANGTKVNGVLIDVGETQELKHADLIEVGASRLIFTGTDGDDVDPIINSEIGGYRVLSMLGRSSTGAVYKAQSLSDQSVVALKTLPRDIAQDRTRRMRLLREARITAALQHPNVIAVMEHGEVGGVPYLALEFAPQGTLLDELRLHEGLPVRRAVSVMMQLLPALERLEESELIHRDIKPENIFCFDDGVVKLGDFGTSASFSSSRSARAHLVGSPHYMSPELADGLPIDHRSDLYTFGATLYHAIEGNTMFEGSSAEAISQHHGANGTPSPKLWRKDLPEGLAPFVEKLIQKDPAQRYQSASEALKVAKRISSEIAKQTQRLPVIDEAGAAPAPATEKLDLRARPTEIRRKS